MMTFVNKSSCQDAQSTSSQSNLVHDPVIHLPKKHVSENIVKKLLTHITRTIFDTKTPFLDYRAYRYLFEIIFKIIYQYHREWFPWSYEKPPRVYDYRISKASDEFGMEPMFGFVIYVCNGQVQFRINKIR